MTTSTATPTRIDYRRKANRIPRRTMTEAEREQVARAYAGQLARLVQLVALDIEAKKAETK